LGSTPSAESAAEKQTPLESEFSRF